MCLFAIRDSRKVFAAARRFPNGRSNLPEYTSAQIQKRCTHAGHRSGSLQKWGSTGRCFIGTGIRGRATPTFEPAQTRQGVDLDGPAFASPLDDQDVAR